MNSVKKLALTLLLAVVSNLSFGQFTLSGSAVDGTTNELLPFATIILFKQSTDTIVQAISTDATGKFKFQNIHKGNYTLHGDFIGMKPFIIDSLSITKHTDLGILSFKKGVEIEEVQITAKKPTAVLKMDKKTFEVSDNGAANGGSAVEVLNNLPSVDVDQDGNVTLRGSSNLRILIDGKPTGLSGDDIGIILAQIPANTIKSIEIITVPTAKYDAESSGGIINITLKENKRQGVNGNVSLSYGNWDKVNASTFIGYKKDKINLSVNYGLRTGTYFIERNSSSSNSTIDTLDLFSIIGDGDKNSLSHLGKLKFSYLLAPNTDISLNSTVSSGQYTRRRTSNYNWDYSNGTVDLHRERVAHRIQQKTNFVNSLSLDHSFKKEAKISFSSTHNYNVDIGDGDYLESGIEQVESNNTKSHIFTQNLDISIPYEIGKTEFGSQHMHRIINNDFHFYDEPNLGDTTFNNFNYFDDITAGYIMQSFKGKSWSINAGYRLEYTHSNSKNELSNLDVVKNYFMHFPSLNLSKSIGKKDEVGFNYSRRITRPNARQLNPSPSLTDPYSLHTGNPDIIPATNDVNELSWLHKQKKFSIQSTIFYQLRLNRVRRIRFVDENGVSNVKWVNYDREDYYGFELFTYFQLGKHVTSNFSANIYERNTDGSNISPTYVTKYYGWDGKLNITVKLPKNFKVQFNGQYKSPKKIVIGTIDARYFFDINIQKSILKKKGKIAVRLSDVLNTRQFEIETLVDNWDQKGVYKRESRILFVSFSYRFGSEKQSDSKKPSK